MYHFKLLWNDLCALSNNVSEKRGLAITSLGFIAVYLVYCLVYGLLFCPTRHIPGPLFSRFSKLYFIRLLFKGTLSVDVYNLHKKYGPVLRIGPNMIDVQLSEVTIQAWGGHNETKLPWNKDPEFCKLARIGMKVDNIISTSSAEESKRLRRLMGPPFAKKFLVDQGKIFKDSARRFLDQIDKLRMENDNKVDVLHEYKTYALDLITEFGFGGYFKGGLTRPGVSVIKAMDQSVFENIFSNIFPTISKILKSIPWSMFEWTHSTDEIIQLCIRSIEEYKSKAKPGSRRDSLNQLINSKDDSGASLSQDELVAASIILLFAGVESTTTALTYVSYVLGKYPEIREELVEELSSYSDVDSFDLYGLEKLPLLNSVIRETMRFWPPAPAPFARLSPPRGVMLGGYHIPGGIQVSRAAFGACRDPEVFSDPETFNPRRFLYSQFTIADNRWIGLSREEETKMWDQSMIFSYGPRVCLGRDMAMMEIRVLISAMVLNYTWCGVPDEPGKWDEEMRPFDSLVIHPWNKKCVLELKPRK